MSTESRIADLINAVRLAREAADLGPLLSLVPYAAYLGMQAEPTDDGLLFHLPFRDDLVGNASLPALHGGALAGFMEMAALLATTVAERQQRIPKPVDFSLDYLRSAGPRDTHARCKLVRHGRRVAMVQVSSWQQDESTPVAVARVHLLLEAVDTSSGDVDEISGGAPGLEARGEQ